MHPIDIDITALFPALTDRPERGAGLHVSDVVRDLCSRIDPKRYPPYAPSAGPRPVNARMEIGNIIEDLIGDAVANRLSKLHADNVWRPGEIEVDGLLGNPDLVFLETPASFGFDTPGPAVVECKATWISTNNDIDSGRFSYWQWQLKTYCKALSINRGILLPVHVNGNYTFKEETGGGPQFKPYGEDWTDRELSEHMTMITNHAARLRAKGHGR